MAVVGIILFFAFFLALFKLGGALYKKFYWWERKQRIETQMRMGLKDGRLTREVLDDMRERGEL